MAEAGAPTELTEEVTLKIRLGVLKGRKNKEIREELDINENTWDYWFWADYQGFRTKMIGWRKERMIRKAEKNIDDLLDSTDERVKADMTKFTLETLAKDEGYSKRTELNGAITNNNINTSIECSPDEQEAVKQALLKSVQNTGSQE